MNVRLHFLFTLLTASLIPQTGGAQELSTDVRQKIGKFLDATARKEVSVGRIRIDSVSIETFWSARWSVTAGSSSPTVTLCRLYPLGAAVLEQNKRTVL